MWKAYTRNAITPPPPPPTARKLYDASRLPAHCIPLLLFAWWYCRTQIYYCMVYGEHTNSRKCRQTGRELGVLRFSMLWWAVASASAAVLFLQAPRQMLTEKLVFSWPKTTQTPNTMRFVLDIGALCVCVCVWNTPGIMTKRQNLLHLGGICVSASGGFCKIYIFQRGGGGGVRRMVQFYCCCCSKHPLRTIKLGGALSSDEFIVGRVSECFRFLLI